jgi:branched-chain amino acid transport system ATP-binding protein
MCFTLFPVLAERRDQLAGTLSRAEQQMVAIARRLASSPKLLLLDEPSMGLAPIVVKDMIFERIESLHEEMKLSILLVEAKGGGSLGPM